MQSAEIIATIRRKPGMYIGGTDGQAVTHMIWEVVANAIDEYMPWKVTGPNTAEIAVTNSGAMRKATFDDEATTTTFGSEGDTDREVANRVVSVK